MKILKKAVITAFAAATPLASVIAVGPTVAQAQANDVNIDGVCTHLEGANTRLFIENRTLLSHDQGGVIQSQDFTSTHYQQVLTRLLVRLLTEPTMILNTQT